MKGIINNLKGHATWIVLALGIVGMFVAMYYISNPVVAVAWFNSTSTINVTGDPNNFSSVAADINDSSIFYFHPFDNASTTNLSLFIPFDDRVNNNASDLTGNGNNGVIENG